MSYLFPEDDHEYYADEIGLVLAGLFAREPNGVPKTGFLAVRPTIEAVSGAWRVRVGAATYVHQIKGSVQISGLDAAVEVDIQPADGIAPGQARIDLVVYDPSEATPSVITGTPASSPTAPLAGGLVPMAQVRVNAGDGGAIQAQITPVFTMTGFASQQGTWVQAQSSGDPIDGLALRNGWQNNINANWEGLQSRRTSAGLEVTGAVTKVGAYGALETIALLPDSMRPSRPTFLSAAYGQAGRYILVRPTGEIVTVVAGSGGQIALGGTIATEL